jgi:hypothetical protein
VTLTPFTVNSDRDTGFAAASALAGGRLASDLRDTPAAYPVITREFIEALNLTDLQSAQNWTTGSTFNSDIGTYNFTTFTVRYSSRGVTAGNNRGLFPGQRRQRQLCAGALRFRARRELDRVRERQSRRLSSSTTKRARTDRAFQDFKVSGGSWDLIRGHS